MSLAARLSRSPEGIMGAAILVLLALAALSAPFVFPRDPLSIVGPAFVPPFREAALPLGTDGLGRDVLAELAHGARASLFVGLAAAAAALLAGTLVGTVAGFLGGFADDVLMRLTDAFQTVPGFLLALVLGAVVAMMAVVAMADYLFQYRQWYERQKMSPREMKEEFKQSEGDPAIKGKMKQLRTNRSRKRMMANVPKAAVIITNPTHYSIALQYERGMEAPICVAKGVDAVALKIREVAGQHSIPIVENPPLARALHATVEVDQAIPVEHYKAVAEVIGYVMRLRRAVVRPPSPDRH